MLKHLRTMAVAALAAAATACSDAPTDANQEFDGELVITEGVGAPEYVARVRPVFSDATASASLGGSTTTPVTLKPQSCDPGQSVTITYRVSGRQDHPASFKVNTTWHYNGIAWSGSAPMTVNVAARASAPPPPPQDYAVTVALINASGVGAGTSSFVIAPFEPVTSSPGALNISSANVTMNVTFAECPVTNTPPALVLPNDMTVEATSSAGATVMFEVTASDAQDGDLTDQVVCTPPSGSVFALGTTTVECSITDTGGLTATGTFDITVEDTTPAIFTSFPTGTVTLIAANINGAVLDIDALNITVEDVNNVSEPSTFTCDYVEGTMLAIGSLTDVDCTAKDAIGNESEIHTFQVFVGLNVSATGFLPPLRMVAPFSAHKKGSTVPHKFLPPTYADGTPAIDLAGGLNLAIRFLDGSPDEAAIPVNDYSAGSTEWRYDPESGHYIFNLKTQTIWATGSWNTTVSYAGIPLASTQFELKK